MGAIIERVSKTGKRTYLAQIKIVRQGVIQHRENRTFERRQAASAWLEKREKELNAPGGLDRAKQVNPSLDQAIQRYVLEYQRDMGRTKAQVLKTIQGLPLAQKPINEITSADVISMLLGIEAQPSTRGNYLSHLSTIFVLAKPAWGYDVDPSIARDAATSAKRLGIISKSRQRTRRPTLEELDKLLMHFQGRQSQRTYMIPMTRIILFALFSTRRQEEITRIYWKDLEIHNKRVLVRDMKNPGEKLGNDVWCDLPDPALKVILGEPRMKDQIFPYNPNSISANFTRACYLLGINTRDMLEEDKLTFHDLRHEGTSRLFEMGLNIPHVAAVTGHRSWTSLKRYTHIRSTGDKYLGWKWLP